MAKVFINDEFHRYVLDAVSSADERYYRFLSTAEKNILSNLDAVSLDEKLRLLGKLNHRFAIVVLKKHKLHKPVTIGKVRAIFRFLKQKVLAMLGTTLKDYGMFIMADKEIMEGLEAISCQARGEHYYVLRDYEEIAANIHRTSDVYFKAAVETQAIRMVNALIAETYALPTRIKNHNEKGRYDVSSDHLPLLFFLAARPEQTVSYQEVSLHFGFGYTNTSFKKKLDQLVTSGHCQKVDDNRYQLTGFGVHIVTQLRERIIAKA
jgi:hypothetical protein